MKQDGHSQEKYLIPITHVITDVCDPTSCSEIMPVAMKNLDGEHLCQFENHIKRCKESVILQPKRDISGQLALLKNSELKLSTLEGSLPNQLELFSIVTSTKIKATEELMGAVTQNMLECQDNECVPAGTKFREGLARTILPGDINLFVFNNTLKILAITALLIFYLEKICGIQHC